MAFLITHFWPGATEEQYRTTLDALHPEGGLPEGQTFHAGGPTEGGILISAVWDSEEAFDDFMQNTLIPSMPIEGGFSGHPEQRTADVMQLLSV